MSISRSDETTLLLHQYPPKQGKFSFDEDDQILNYAQIFNIMQNVKQKRLQNIKEEASVTVKIY